MYSLFLALLLNSAIAAALFLGVWLVKRIFRFRLSAGMHYLIWCVVLLKLLIPVQMLTALSPWNLLPQQAAVEYDEAPSADNEAGYALQEDMAELALNLPDVIMVVWAAGMAAMGLWLVKGAWRLRKNARSARPAPEWAATIFEQCKRELKIKQNVRLSVGGISVPAVRRVFRPMVMLPAYLAERKDEGALRLILLHELMHVKRRDLAVTYVMNIINVIYWFNPAMWLLVKLINADMETACDASVLRVLGAESRQPYIKTLVRFAGERAERLMRPTLSLSDNGVKMKRRIEGMFLNKKTNKPVKAMVMLIVCMFAVLCFTAACTPQGAAPGHGTDNAAVEHSTSADPAAVSQAAHTVITADGVKLTIDGLDYYITESLEHNSGNTDTANDDPAAGVSVGHSEIASDDVQLNIDITDVLEHSGNTETLHDTSVIQGTH